MKAPAVLQINLTKCRIVFLACRVRQDEPHQRAGGAAAGDGARAAERQRAGERPQPREELQGHDLVRDAGRRAAALPHGAPPARKI